MTHISHPSCWCSAEHNDRPDSFLTQWSHSLVQSPGPRFPWLSLLQLLSDGQAQGTEIPHTHFVKQMLTRTVTNYQLGVWYRLGCWPWLWLLRSLSNFINQSETLKGSLSSNTSCFKAWDCWGKQENKISPRMEDNTSEAEQLCFGTVVGNSVSVVKSKLLWIDLSVL